MAWQVLATTCTDTCGCPPDLPQVGRTSAPVELTDGPFVYYAGVGDRIKIGHTQFLACRLSAIKAEALLAIEPGDYKTERLRHDQFGHRRIEGEWFALAADLLDHCEALSRKYVVPPVPRRRPKKPAPNRG